MALKVKIKPGKINFGPLGIGTLMPKASLSKSKSKGITREQEKIAKIIRETIKEGTFDDFHDKYINII